MTIAPTKEDHVSVSTACLELSEIAAIVADPRAGAISTFSGTTRDNHFGERSRRVEGAAKESRPRCRSCRGLDQQNLEPVPHSSGTSLQRAGSPGLLFVVLSFPPPPTRFTVFVWTSREISTAARLACWSGRTAFSCTGAGVCS